MMPGLRARFVLELVDAAWPRTNSLGVTRVQKRLPAGAARWFTLGLERKSYPDAIPLDEATTLLLCLDEQLGVGSGQYLEQLVQEYVSPILARDVVSLASSSPRTLLLRLIPAIESIWMDVIPHITATETAGCLRVELGVAGSPRATRFLLHQTLGTLQAAQQLVPLRHLESPRPMVEWFADRVRIELPLRISPVRQGEFDAISPQSRPSQRNLRAARPSLSEQVENILGHREPEGRSSNPPPENTAGRRENELRSSRPPGGSSPPPPPSTGPSSVRESQRGLSTARVAVGPEGRPTSETSLAAPRVPRFGTEAEPRLPKKNNDDE
jgi:hypothetical protein